MVSNKLIKKFRENYPKYKDWNSKTIENWLEQRRDLDICAICPDDTRGLCCFGALDISLPSKELCKKTCTEYLRGKCTYDRTNLPEKSENVFILMSEQPCKFLDLKTKLCDVYEDRFWKNRNCTTVHDSIKLGCLPKDCAYLSEKQKKKYIKSPYKIPYDLVKDKLCDWGMITWDLYNTSPHEGKYGIGQY